MPIGCHVFEQMKLILAISEESHLVTVSTELFSIMTIAFQEKF